MPKSRERDRAVITPRGLSRVLAAEYIGVSTSFFDQLVAEGKMPRPKHVGSRRIWDRWAVDNAFEDLGMQEMSPLEIWKANEAAETTAKPSHFFLMTEEQYRDEILSRKMDKRGRHPMRELYSQRDRDVAHNEIKGAGIGTHERLEVRRYATMTKDEDRFLSWRITEAGVAAVQVELATAP
jgi:predicted DNA-binding transcriptional regulator AlpA